MIFDVSNFAEWLAAIADAEAFDTIRMLSGATFSSSLSPTLTKSLIFQSSGPDRAILDFGASHDLVISAPAGDLVQRWGNVEFKSSKSTSDAAIVDVGCNGGDAYVDFVDCRFDGYSGATRSRGAAVRCTNQTAGRRVVVSVIRPIARGIANNAFTTVLATPYGGSYLFNSLGVIDPDIQDCGEEGVSTHEGCTSVVDGGTISQCGEYPVAPGIKATEICRRVTMVAGASFGGGDGQGFTLIGEGNRVEWHHCNATHNAGAANNHSVRVSNHAGTASWLRYIGCRMTINANVGLCNIQGPADVLFDSCHIRLLGDYRAINSAGVLMSSNAIGATLKFSRSIIDLGSAVPSGTANRPAFFDNARTDGSSKIILDRCLLIMPPDSFWRGLAYGTLTTRTSDTAGVATLQVGHGLNVGNTIDIVWASGQRFSGSVSGVSGADVTFSGGSGPNLPIVGTALSMAATNGFILCRSGAWIDVIGCTIWGVGNSFLDGIQIQGATPPGTISDNIVSGCRRQIVYVNRGSQAARVFHDNVVAPKVSYVSQTTSPTTYTPPTYPSLDASGNCVGDPRFLTRGSDFRLVPGSPLVALARTALPEVEAFGGAFMVPPLPPPPNGGR